MFNHGKEGMHLLVFKYMCVELQRKRYAIKKDNT